MKVSDMKILSAPISAVPTEGSISAAQFEGMVRDYLQTGWDLKDVINMKTSPSPTGSADLLWMMAILVKYEEAPTVKASAK